MISDLRVKTAILPTYTEDLFSYHNSWPFAVAALQNILFR